jgi:hypothetical protein
VAAQMADRMALDMPPDQSSWSNLSPTAVLAGLGTAFGTIATAFFAFAGRRVDGRNVAQALSNDAQKNADAVLVAAALRAADEIVTLKARVTELDRDVREGWDRGRGMETQAHWFRHELLQAGTRYNGALEVLERVLSGGWDHDRARRWLDAAVPDKEPPAVKRLSDVEKRGP